MFYFFFVVFKTNVFGWLHYSATKKESIAKKKW